VPKFDGNSLGGDLAYDFTSYGHPDVKGAVDDEEMFDKLTDGVTDCLARLCGGEQTPEGWVGGSPTHSQLTALGYRPFMGFFGYLMQNLMNPELQAPASMNSPVRLRSV
jgi:hypothetical protein